VKVAFSFFFRKRPVNDTGSTASVKKIRFMDGYETKYVRREDFVNDAAWKNFLRYKACRDAQSTTSRKNNYKNKQKINNYEELLKNLKAKDSLHRSLQRFSCTVSGG